MGEPPTSSRNEVSCALAARSISPNRRSAWWCAPGPRSRISAASKRSGKRCSTPTSIAYSDSGSGTYLSTHAVREARRCGSGGAQESEGARTSVRRTSSRGRRARRSGNRLSTGQRAHTRSWCDLRRGASGGAPAGVLVRRRDHECGPAAGRRARAASVPCVARCSLDDPEERADTARTIARARFDRGTVPRVT